MWLSKLRFLCNKKHSFKFLLLLTFLFVIAVIHVPSILPSSSEWRPFSFYPRLLHGSDINNNQSIEHLVREHQTSFRSLKSFDHNRTLDTTVRCVGSLNNQSCLFTNLYFVDSAFTILALNTTNLSNYSVRTDAFHPWDLNLQIRRFASYSDLENFVRTVINPKRIPSVTLHFGQPWLHNVGHALFDGLYPAYLALIRFPPRHLLPFRILGAMAPCDECWSEDIYSRFGGLGVIKLYVLNHMSIGRWFLFDEIVMGSGALCQRCTQSDFQLPGGIKLDGTRLFRDRMYQQHGLLPSIARHNSSSERRSSRDVLLAYVIDNKRFTDNDRKQIQDAIDEINNYTISHLNQTVNNQTMNNQTINNQTMNNQTRLEWPLINVTYIYYNRIKAQNPNNTGINATPYDSRSPTYELLDNNFIAQLKLVQQTDIQLSGPGTAQMYQSFLSDGSVFVNLGGVLPWGLENTNQAYASYLEQYLTSGTPYIKGLYYPINERMKGITKDEVVRLIRQAGQMILEGFHLPVDPLKNLAPDAQLFVEMCARDRQFCSLVTDRSPYTPFNCLDIWIEDFVHEYRQWKLGVHTDGINNYSCPFNRTLLRELRQKYDIKHYLDK